MTLLGFLLVKFDLDRFSMKMMMRHSLHHGLVYLHCYANSVLITFVLEMEASFSFILLFFFPFCSVHTCIHVDQEKMRLSHKGLKAFPAVPHLSAAPCPIHRRHHHLLRESYFMSNLQTPERGAIFKSLYLLVLCLCGSQDSVMMLKVLLIHQMFVIQGVDYLKYDNCFNLGIPPKERFFNLP